MSKIRPNRTMVGYSAFRFTNVVNIARQVATIFYCLANCKLEMSHMQYVLQCKLLRCKLPGKIAPCNTVTGRPVHTSDFYYGFLLCFLLRQKLLQLVAINLLLVPFAGCFFACMQTGLCNCQYSAVQVHIGLNACILDEYKVFPKNFTVKYVKFEFTVKR